MKGFFEKMQEAQRKTEEQQARFSTEMDTLRKERQAADAVMSLAIGAAGQKTEALSAKTESLIAGMAELGEGQARAEQVEALGKAGAAAMQLAASAGAEVARSIAAFTGHYPAWIADGGTEGLNHITEYNGTAYICINPIQRLAHWTPDAATNNYCPYPSADRDGVYPYVSGMLVWGGMKVRGGDGEIYRCTLTEGTYKLVNEPKDAASIFEIDLPFS
jgi:hypothetical protein